MKKSENIMLWLEKVSVFFLYYLVVALPFSKTLVEGSAILVLMMWLAKRIVQWRAFSLSSIKAFTPRSTFLNVPIGVFLILGIISTLLSVSKALSCEGLFLKLFELVLIFFITAEFFDSPRRIKKFFFILFIPIAILIIDIIAQSLTGFDLLRSQARIGSYIIQGPFSNSNDLAGWLLLTIPIIFSLACLRTKDWKGVTGRFTSLAANMRLILSGVTILLMSCLFFTYSRGAWIAFLLSIIFLYVLKVKKTYLFIVVILVCSIIIAMFLFAIFSETSKETLEYIFKAGNQGVSIRIQLWREAIDIIKDHPFFGCGLNTYATVAPGYKLTETTGFYPHSSYLRMAAESGLLGLGAFIWILITLFKTSLANLRKINEGFYSALLGGLLTGLFAFLIHSFVDTNIYSLQLGILMWFTMALIVVVQKVALET